jgi:predicted transcriptional regulator
MNDELLALTADIVSAHVSNNKTSVNDVPALIASTFEALNKLGQPAEADAPKAEPAVSIRSSIKPDYIVCLEDGKKLTMLKRYLRTNFNMTPDDYRAKWGLPRDYPMVAPNYAEKRRGLAVQIGLGRKKAVETVAKVEKTIAKPVKRAAKSVSDRIAAAREHLGTAEAKPARKPRAKKTDPAATPVESATVK